MRSSQSARSIKCCDILHQSQPVVVDCNDPESDWNVQTRARHRQNVVKTLKQIFCKHTRRRIGSSRGGRGTGTQYYYVGVVARAVCRGIFPFFFFISHSVSSNRVHYMRTAQAHATERRCCLLYMYTRAAHRSTCFFSFSLSVSINAHISNRVMCVLSAGCLRRGAPLYSSIVV